ncbi:membrane protein YqaA with SNARE-associated domain [Idiomarina loihiensis]|uniref:YqaA family protein n=1 Tax=Idiomarina TaxID=135575 RepID=UPI000D71C700|nr:MULTISPECIES: YqaA family protein [Idiomarina]PWW35290.1 membrane protein YqaA with SNARE-associated domain [Idiomarina loihiensis]TDP45230.1 membrane protein YqaA with SNARE-associated domain [Idiomarina loihiensis]TDS21049.1 membrane protein YqaA with SNARE-associated domain [Idiomarina sp. H2]
MKLFSALYDKVLSWTQHPRADIILGLLSFAESVIFPIPPDVMLAPMAMTQPKRAWRLAFLTTVTSVAGGILGYFLGYWAYESLVLPAVEALGYESKLLTVQGWFADWGVWIVFIAGFSPIPYKLFTVTAGVMQIAFFPFVIASAISRGMRFYLVAWLLRTGGPEMGVKLREYVDRIGWTLVILVIIGYVIAQLV